MKILISFVLTFASFASFAQSTQNVGMKAAPAPGKVVIDGKVDDWDLSGERLMCYDVTSLKDRYSVKTSVMYDSDNFYVLLRWKDPTPMVNFYDPKTEVGQAWKADCVQLRIKTDRIASVDCWYYTKDKKPSMFIHYGAFGLKPPDPDTADLEDAMKAGARQAFLMDSDSKGYTQEIAIPWKLLTRDGHTVKAGETMICGFELLWGKDSGRDFPVHRFADNVSEQARSGAIFFWTGPQAWGSVSLEKQGHFSLPPQTFQGVGYEMPSGPISIPVKLEKPGFVTLSIDDSQGGRIRNLLREAYLEAGSHEIRWDGADDDGKLVSTGDYSWKGLVRDNLHVNFAMAYNNPGDPPWDTADRKSAWLSDHTNPSSVAADADRIYVNCPGVEAGWAPAALDFDGRKIWGSKDAGIQITVENGLVYSVTDPGGPYGAKPGTKNPVNVTVTRLDAKTGFYAPFKNPSLPSGGIKAVIHTYQAPPNSIYEMDTDILNLQGAAVRDGKLCVSLRLDNIIRILDAETSVLIKDIKITQPAGLAFDSSGLLLAVSEKKLVAIDIEKGEVKDVVAGALDDPQQVCVAGNGDIIVSDWGKSRQLKIFSREGKSLRSVGVKGGRPLMGAYDPAGFFRPRGVAADAKGRLWVAEDTDSPRRISVWSMDGKLEKEFVGPGYYSGGGLLDPSDKTRAYYHNMEFKLNFETGTYKLAKIVSGFFGSEAFRMAPGTGHPSKLTTVNGKTYLSRTPAYGDSQHWDIAIRRDDGVFQPAAAAGIVAQLAEKGPTAFRGKDKSLRFSWADANGDGLVQDAELKFAPASKGKKPESWGCYWEGSVRDDLTLVVPATTDSVWAKDAVALWNFPPVSWNACGAPVYDVANPIVQTPSLSTNAVTSIIVLKDGSVVANSNPVVAYDLKGKLLWTFPNPDLNPYDCGPLRSGKLLGPQAFLGSLDMGKDIGEIVMFNGYNGSRFLMTGDGLWLGHVFNDGRNGPAALPAHPTPGFLMDDMTCGGESFSGTFMKANDGKIYTTTGMTEARIVEVKGLDTIKRLKGAKFAVSTELRSAAEKALAEKAKNIAEAKTELVVEKTEAAPKTDGELSDWDLSRGVSWKTAPDRNVAVALKHDSKNLYMAYKVDDPSPMLNSGKNQNLLFKTGDCVDLWLGTDPLSDPKRVNPVKGDIRLLISEMDGKAIAVLYEALVPGTKEPIPFSSPARTVNFDKVTVLSEAQIAIVKRVDGYTVEASIPLAKIGLKPQPAVIRGDVGVVLSDATGSKGAQRSCWSNKATNIVMDVPDESMLQPSKWGTVIVK
ncbi:MAG: sugar-binding protein [Victivallales bacterium]